MRILITGPQGSGKTTESEKVAEDLNIPLIDSGRMLRDLAEVSSEDGQRVKEALGRGGLVPDEIVGEIVKKRIENEDCGQGFVVDGYPRRLSQLQAFDPDFDRVFYLDIKDSLVKERLIKRGREDDTPELIEKRLSLYHELTEPVLEYYNNLGKLERIDGSLSEEKVHEQIKERLKK